MTSDNPINYLTMVTQLGTTMAACILVGFFCGHWLDGVLNTKPWFLLAGLVLGILSGFLSVYRLITRYVDLKK